MPSNQICVFVNDSLVDTFQVNRPVIVGRCDRKLNDPRPIAMHQGTDHLRLIVADERERQVPRNWFVVSPAPNQRFRIENIHAVRLLTLSGDATLGSGEERQFENEISVDVGCGVSVRISPEYESIRGSEAYRTLEMGTSGFGTSGFGTTAQVAGAMGSKLDVGVKNIGQFAASDAQEIAKMLQLALRVVQESAGSDAFFQTAVTATHEIVDLERTMLLMRSDSLDAEASREIRSLADGWSIVAEHPRPTTSHPARDSSISSTVLRRVRETCATVIHDPLAALHDADAPSLIDLACAVASPILNQQRECIGVLYGHRGMAAIKSADVGINDMEATLVQILAWSVAGGIARRAEERMRSRLSEFFSPKVASELGANPDFMEGQDTEVSVLFCDLRGFSSVTESLEPKQAIEWINDVMSELSQCVIDRDGVLVDYVGDELFAMWGAPGNQTDHATRAITTARAMLEAIEMLRTRWRSVLSLDFGAGIGINTGIARVGNVGSRQKFKYGPLGNTVNLGSRLQSVTKQLGVECIAGASTVAAANCQAECRRLAKLAVVGIAQPIDVYEVAKVPSESWQRQRDLYESALDDFENCRFGEAVEKIGNILTVNATDAISRKLLARAAAELDEPSESFSGVWKLTQK